MANNMKKILSIDIYDNINDNGVGAVNSIRDTLYRIYGGQYSELIDKAIAFMETTIVNKYNDAYPNNSDNGREIITIGDSGIIEFTYAYITGINTYNFTIIVYHAMYSKDIMVVDKRNILKAYQTFIRTPIYVNNGYYDIANPGDYIVTYADGTNSIVKPDEFNDKYVSINLSANNEDLPSHNHTKLKSSYIKDQDKEYADSFIDNCIKLEEKVNKYLKKWGFYCAAEDISYALVDRINELEENENGECVSPKEEYECKEFAEKEIAKQVRALHKNTEEGE